MAVIAIIPARYGSSRFPGKVLAADTGRPLIEYVWRGAMAASQIERCVVATDDARVAQAVERFGGEVCLTRSDHVSGSDRIAEAADKLDLEPDELVVNVQGDEPEIEPAALDALVERMRDDATCSAGTLACPFPDDADVNDPNRVKLVCDTRRRALYFSRAPIPHPRRPGAAPLLHIGVYAYRAAFLKQFATWSATPLEQTEQLEQLRILEHGERIAVAVTDWVSHGVDTPEDYARFVARQQAGQAMATDG